MNENSAFIVVVVAMAAVAALGIAAFVGNGPGRCRDACGEGRVVSFSEEVREVGTVIHRVPVCKCLEARP